MCVHDLFLGHTVTQFSSLNAGNSLFPQALRINFTMNSSHLHNPDSVVVVCVAGGDGQV